jgi:general secretion pathway protein C
MVLKSYPGLFYLAVIATGAYLGADIVSRLLWSKLETTLRTHAAPQNLGAFAPSDTGDAAHTDPDGNDLILSGSLFRAEGNEPAPGETTTTISKPPSDFVLLGTIVGRGRHSYAIIEQSKTQEQGLYRQGDVLSGDTRVGAIHRNRVLLHRQDLRETLSVSFAAEEVAPLAGAVPASIPATSTDGGGIRTVSKNRYVLDRREVTEATENLPKLLTQARVVPHFKDGTPDGFRIFSIRKDSLYAKIGLQNGDVVHQVNDIQVKDPQNFLQVFEQLKGESHITVDLVRNNKKETLAYEIR